MKFPLTSYGWGKITVRAMGILKHLLLCVACRPMSALDIDRALLSAHNDVVTGRQRVALTSVAVSQLDKLLCVGF